MIEKEFARVKQDTEILVGQRGDRTKMAVVRGDFPRIPQMRARTVTAAPTKDEYNALLEDVKALRAALVAASKQ